MANLSFFLLLRNSQVKCLYFVARGTLDDVLWKLLEKKFRDLGEFVEGKEKLKMVVDKEYNGTKELHSAMFQVLDESGDENDEGSGDGDDDDEADFQLDGDLVHDIEELGEEERRMLGQSEETGDDGDGEPTQPIDVDLDTKMPAKESFTKSSSKGLTEDDAIALDSDDEDDETANQKSGAVVTTQPAEATLVEQGPVEDENDILSGSRHYRIIFGDTVLGLKIILHHGRVVIRGITKERVERLGGDSKPSVGDILVAVDDITVHPTNDIEAVEKYLKQVLQQPPTTLQFLEAPKFATAFNKHVKKMDEVEAASAAPALRATHPPAAAQHPSGEVIDLLDDD